MNPKDNVTVEDSYNAMLYFLRNFIEVADSTDITDILSGAEYFSNGEISDPAFWYYWVDAIKEAKDKGKPPGKQFSI